MAIVKNLSDNLESAGQFQILIFIDIRRTMKTTGKN